MEESSWPVVYKETAGADLVSSSIVLVERTNGGGLHSQDDIRAALAVYKHRVTANDSYTVKVYWLKHHYYCLLYTSDAADE